MKKKIWIGVVALVTVLVVSLGVGSTLAYLSDIDEKANHMELGQVQGHIDEDKWPGDQDIVDGGTYDKNPKVVNENVETPAYVRARVVSSDSRVGVTCNTADSKTFTLGSIAEGTYGDWVYSGGYFYYNGVLQPSGQAGDTTGSLFESFTVSVPDEIKDQIFVGDLESGTEYGFDVYVIAELVQASGLPITYGDNEAQNAIASFAYL